MNNLARLISTIITNLFRLITIINTKQLATLSE